MVAVLAALSTSSFILDSSRHWVVMVVLRRLCFSSPTYLSAETPLSSLQSNYRSNLSSCHPPSSFEFPSLSLVHNPDFWTKETRDLVLKFASTSQEQALDSFPSNFSAETQETEAENEEFSKTRLLASNVLWTSAPEDIRSLFERHGKVVDVELSMYNNTRNRGLAFIKMGSPEEALAALKNLESYVSYRVRGSHNKSQLCSAQKEENSSSCATEAVTFNLFVANLSYEARSKHVMEFFESGSSGVLSVEIIFYDNPSRSSGYGFVSFKSKKEADAALSEFQGKIFMGRALRVARGRQFVKQAIEENAGAENASPKLNASEEKGKNAA